MKRGLLFFLFILLLGSVSANYIYGDIYISELGKATFIVNTDVDLELSGLEFENNRLKGETFDLVSMRSGVWTFEIDSGYYDTILLDIHLPENLKRIDLVEGVNYLIDFDKGTISLIDGDKGLYFKIKYETEERRLFSLLYFFVAVTLLGLFIFLFVKFKKKKRAEFEKIFPFINDKEREILEVLMKGPMRQKDVRKRLGIPKASYSRYLANLEKKKLLTREGKGRNKVLRLR